MRWLTLLSLVCLVTPACIAAAADEKSDDAANSHWAFQRPVRPALPQVQNAEWVRNPIDAFVAAEHEKRGLIPNPPAAKHVLLRRVYLDLTGLPPTRDELHEFLADPSDDAYERAVDRLLASPRYGERWARHWMDVWRYSDWYGRRAVPDVWNSAPQVWRWRDWIVRSLNSDKGYDRMVMEMLAADEIAPDDDENAVATGYLARNWYALNPNQWMRDNVEHTGKAFLGLTLNCAHCHDHKYDPISQQEYFQFRAFFEPIQLRQDRVWGEPDPGPFQKYEYSVLRKVVNIGSVHVFDEKLDAKTLMYRLGDERDRIADKPPVVPAAPAFLGGDRLKIEPIKLPPTAHYPGLKPFIQHDAVALCEAALKSAETALAHSQQALATAEQQLGAGPDAAQADAKRIAAERSLRLCAAQLAGAHAQLAATRARIAADNARYRPTPDSNAAELAELASRLERKAKFCAAQAALLAAEQALAAAKAMPESDPKAKDAAAKAQQQVESSQKAVYAALEAMTKLTSDYTPLSPVYPARSTGRRRALAQWIASRDNPLTARVAVNHIWTRHVGRPLVGSVFDFGRNGAKPTHPELLDWLAVELVDSGWNMKHLHRLIVTSNTYRMQSGPVAPDNPNLAIDRDNRSLWRLNPVRIEAEVLRDAVLHAAGQLDEQMGGVSLENSLESKSFRRSLYFSVYPEDGGHMRFLELFDAPDPCDCYRRSENILPQQALAMTNSQLLLNQSRMLARRLTSEIERGAAGAPASNAAFIVAAFEQILSRSPTAEEQATCADFLRRQSELFRAADPKQPSGPATDGVVAPSADFALRARESLVRALFSHDDFVTVR